MSALAALRTEDDDAGTRMWLVDLDADGQGPLGEARPTQEERERCAQFADAAAGSRFLRSRLAVRDVLGRWLSVPPARLRLACTPGGKPYLPDHPGRHISWSRSQRLLLVGASVRGEVGVDIEWARPVSAAEEVLATVRPGLPAPADPAAFLPAWTLLEAAVKATGRGLARGAKEVDLAFGPGGTVTLSGIRGHGPGTWRGRTRLLPAGDGVPAAVAALVTRSAARAGRDGGRPAAGTPLSPSDEPRSSRT